MLCEKKLQQSLDNCIMHMRLKNIPYVTPPPPVFSLNSTFHWAYWYSTSCSWFQQLRWPRRAILFCIFSKLNFANIHFSNFALLQTCIFSKLNFANLHFSNFAFFANMRFVTYTFYQFLVSCKLASCNESQWSKFFYLYVLLRWRKTTPTVIQLYFYFVKFAFL